jgi:hypothetical protein
MGNTQQRGRWQQRPMGSGGNELPLGRELRMNVTPPEGTGPQKGPNPLNSRSLNQLLLPVILLVPRLP